jgi:hypothetical protein
MKYNDTTNREGVIQACERYTGLGNTEISGDSDRLLEFTAYTNTSLRSIWHLIFESTGCWKYDDSNQTDLPIATTDIVNAQDKYALPSNTLTVARVEILSSDDVWTQITPLIEKEIGQGMDEFRNADGTPQYYRLVGDTMELFPASNYSQDDSLKIYFDRGTVEFSSTDTNKETGLASAYEDLVPMGASLEWLDINLPEDARTAKLQQKYNLKVLQLKKYYNARFPDKKKIMRRLYKSYT